MLVTDAETTGGVAEMREDDGGAVGWDGADDTDVEGTFEEDGIFVMGEVEIGKWRLVPVAVVAATMEDDARVVVVVVLAAAPRGVELLPVTPEDVAVVGYEDSIDNEERRVDVRGAGRFEEREA